MTNRPTILLTDEEREKHITAIVALWPRGGVLHDTAAELSAMADKLSEDAEAFAGAVRH